MTQITTLNQVKRLLDYGGNFIVKDCNNEMVLIFSTRITPVIFALTGNAKGLTKQLEPYHLPMTFHSWVLAPPLEEGEEVYVNDDEVAGGIRTMNARNYYKNSKLIINNMRQHWCAMYALPTRLLEEEKVRYTSPEIEDMDILVDEFFESWKELKNKLNK